MTDAVEQLDRHMLPTDSATSRSSESKIFLFVFLLLNPSDMLHAVYVIQRVSKQTSSTKFLYLAAARESFAPLD